MDDISNPVLDTNAFNSFAELMGTNLAMVLKLHMDLADGYLQKMNAAFEVNDYKTISDIAHTFKSSSQQMGAMKVANIAKEIEQFTKTSTPDIAKLKDLIEQIVQAQEETRPALTPYIC